MLSLSELRDRLEIWGYWFKKIEGNTHVTFLKKSRAAADQMI